MPRLCVLSFVAVVVLFSKPSTGFFQAITGRLVTNRCCLSVVAGVCKWPLNQCPVEQSRRRSDAAGQLNCVSCVTTCEICASWACSRSAMFSPSVSSSACCTIPESKLTRIVLKLLLFVEVCAVALHLRFRLQLRFKVPDSAEEIRGFVIRTRRSSSGGILQPLVVVLWQPCYDKSNIVVFDVALHPCFL